MRWARTLAAAAAGALAGTAAMLAVPVTGVPDGPAEPRARRLPLLGRAPVPTVLAWTSGGLPEGYADTVRRLPSVKEVAEVRSGIVWLNGWQEEEGPARKPPRGLRIPTEIAGIQPRSYQAFVPPGDREMIAGLGDGGALLGETASALRRVGLGGTLRIGEANLGVEGVIDDELVGAHEVVVSASEAANLGITESRYLLVAPKRGVAHRRVEAGLRRVVPPGIRVRVRAPGETPVFRHGDAVLSQVRLKELFGEFAGEPHPDGTVRIDPRWVRENIRDARVPILQGAVRCHRTVIPLLRGALRELARRGLGDLIDPGDYGGCWSPRFLNFDPGAGLSHHAWGVAVDFNVSGNPLGAEPTIDRRVVEVFERWGFQWGGRFLVPDGMHFEFLDFPAIG
jgi:D-alanyl-D-alanine carboxypeptidase